MIRLRSIVCTLAFSITLSALPSGPALVHAESPPTFYYYKGEALQLELDGSRFAVTPKEAITEEVGRKRLLGSLNIAGIPAMSMKSAPMPSSQFLFLESEAVDASDADRMINILVASDQFEFVSPVFRGHFFGWLAVTPEILVRFDPASRYRAEEILFELEPTIQILETDFAGLDGAYRLRSSIASQNGFDVLALANRLAADSRISWAEPDFQMESRRSLIPNDTGFNLVWGIHNTGQSGGTPGMDMGGVRAWDLTTGDSTIIVAVFDDGVDQVHPDLHQIAGEDFTGEGGGGNPFNMCDTHGTTVAGCVSATINNSLGTVGIAPGCRVAGGRICVSTVPCDGTGQCQSIWVANALNWARQQGAKVTNLSWSLGSPNSTIDDAYDNAYANGIVSFASAGNNAVAVLGYPSSHSKVNSISAVGRDGNLASFSSWGDSLAFAAPGVSVYTTDRVGSAGVAPGDYASVSGTSFSSPYSAGVAALLFSLDPTLSAAEVEARLQCSARDRGVAGFDPKYGYGFLNIRNAFGITGIADSTSGPLADAGSATGVAWGDYDGDGDADLFLLNNGANALLENQAGTFVDVTSGDLGNAGAGSGAAWGDFDDDGDLDLVITNTGSANLLLRNDGGGVFADITPAGIGNAGDGVAVEWLDKDNDGDLDLHIVTSSGSSLFENDGTGSFTDVASGAFATTTDGAGIAWGDFDDDGDMDLYLARSVAAGNKLFENNGAGSFTDVTPASIGEASVVSRSAAWADIDNDGDLDLYVGNNGANKLFRNDGGGTFADVTGGLLGDASDAVTVSWADYNNDGHIDLFVGNASPDDNLFFFNYKAKFHELTDTLQTDAGNDHAAAAWADYDGDGLMDLYLGNDGSGNVLLRTTPLSAECDHYIQVDLAGTVSNSHGVGARIRAVAGGKSFIREITAGNGRSQGSLRAEIGIGQTTTVDTLIVSWPSGIDQIVTALAADTLVTITESFIAPVALILSPDGGEDWGVGTVREITWTSTSAVGSDYTLEYSTDNGSSWNPVASGSSGQLGGFDWTVPNDETTQGRVRVLLSNAAGSDRDTSDATFAITAAPITAVTSPNGGESLEIGSNVNITWTNGGGSAVAHTVESSGDSGMTWTLLADSLAGGGGGSLAWVVPNLPSREALVRVTLFNSAGAVIDQSDAFFDIAPPFAPSTLIHDATSAAVGHTGMARGAAWADFDGDGDADLYITNSDGANQLLQNSPAGYSDVTAAPLDDASISYGTAWADVDNDGDLDLYLANDGANKLFENQGGGTFIDGTSGGAGHPGAGRAAAFGDYDNDGDVDLYITNYNESNRLLRNDSGTLIDITPGTVANSGPSWATVWVDYDNDGDQDIYLVNEGSNKIFRNNSNGTFTELGGGLGASDNGTGRGVAWGDYDNDGDLDAYVTNIGPNQLFRNSGGSFTEVSASPVDVDGESYGAAWGDYDLDGDLDLYVAGKYFNRLFRNDGGIFVDAANFETSDAGNSQSVIWGDSDGDGDLDLFVANLGANKLFRNDQTSGNHWLRVKTAGVISNKAGIGARVRAVAGGIAQIRDISGGSGYLSQNSLPADFGLGASTLIDTLQVFWPSGQLSLLTAITVDTALTITEPVPDWADVTASGLIHAGTVQGVSWGDYDGDGDEDLYVSLSFGANKLFRNDDGATFADVSAPPLNDAGDGVQSAWGDYDNDGDLDLYLVNSGTANKLFRNDGGGVFADIVSAVLNDAGFGFSGAWGDHDNDGDLDLYITNAGSFNKLLDNDGAGGFTDITSGPLSSLGFSFSGAWGDHDNDGDLDLYVGNAFSPNQLLENQGGGTFTDITAGPLGDAGSAYGVAWADYDNDGDLDLYVSNESAANKLFRNDGGGVFADVTPLLLADIGGGRGIAWADYDNDGDLDLYLNQSGSNKLFRNEGGGLFSDATDDSLVNAGNGLGAAWADIDSDGDLDLYIATSAATKRLFRNEAVTGNHWVHVNLVGSPSNRSAIGARVRIVAGGLAQIREITGGSGYGSQNSLTAEFGLGSATVVDSIRISWPSGTVQELTGFVADAFYQFLESGDPTGVDEAEAVPAAFLLYGNVPNPFNPTTSIRFGLPERSHINISIYDLAGRLVKTLIDDERDAGYLDVNWQGHDSQGRSVASGLYFVRMQASGFAATKKMMLIR